MLPWLVLLCIVLAPSAAFLLWSWRASRDDMSLMRATETTPAAVIAKLPVGSQVEVKGRLRCAAPLTGDLSKSPCAHFVASVERDYEKLEYDASRKASYRVRGTACVHTNTMSASFEIEDDSGRATVLPEGAVIEGIEAVDRYEVECDAAERERSMQTAAGHDLTLGRRYKEMHLPLDVEIYVLAWSARTAASSRPRPGPRGSAFSSASIPRSRARRSSAAGANGCSVWGSPA